MKHFLRLYRSFQLILGFAVLAAAATCLFVAPPAVHAQAQELAPMFHDPSPFAAQAAMVGYLGVDVADVDASKAQALKLKEVRGALITLIDHDAPAGQIGLKVNDVVLALNGQNVEGAEQLRRMLREIPPGRKVSLEISRDGNIQTLAVQLADRKAMEHDVWDKIGIDAGGIVPVPQLPAMGMIAGGDAPMPPPGGLHMSIFTGSLNVGALVEPLTSQMAEYLGVLGGLMVKQVARKSEAAAAGFKAFDVILKVGSDSIMTSADWDRALRSNAGKPVQVTILRDKKQQTLTLQVDSKHSGTVEFQDLFGPDNDAITEPIEAEVAPFLDPEFTQALSAQAAADAEAASNIARAQADALRESMKNFKIDPQQMEQLQQQMEEIRKNFNPDAFKIDFKQMEQFQQQMEEFRKNFNPDAFKIDPKQMEQLQQQMEEFRKNFNPDAFKIDPKQMEQLRQQMEQFRKSFNQEQMKQLQKQMKQFQREMDQWRGQCPWNFV
jgi:membrane-associated protease RseP (regulator of RpoE activity)